MDAKKGSYRNIPKKLGNCRGNLRSRDWIKIDSLAARAMFGGYGVYWDGVMFGLIADDVLYFKVDATNRREYEAAGSRPFTYQAVGRKKIALSYWEVPATILDDRDEWVAWAQKSRKINAAANRMTGE